jgi:cellulose synthase/poly-beta-1,6-N-acetylglucosamine synthase-like glycosyltransferase
VATGTNVMIRARAAFQVCRYAEKNAQTDVTRPLGGMVSEDRRQIYAEDEISEDVELGARMHAYGYKSVIVCERLASGEVRSHSYVFFLTRAPVKP